MSNYHDHPALSRSGIKTFRDEGRRVFHARHVLRLPEAQVKPTDAMNLGTLVHAELLEPGTLESRLVVRPEQWKDWRTAAAKAWRDEQQAAGKIVLTPGEVDAATEMVRAAAAIVGDFMAANNVVHVEQEIFWTDAATQLECRCKPDLLIVKPEGVYAFDLKTTDSVMPSDFRKTVIGHGYAFQHMHYSLGILAHYQKPVLFYFVGVERDYPFRAAMFELDLLPEALAEYRRTLDAIKACHDSGDWREPWEPTINRVEVGGWAVRSDSVPLET